MAYSISPATGIPLLLLYDSRQIVVARARVPLRHMDPDVLAELAGDTLPELFAEIEFFKDSCIGFPKDVPVCVEYVAGQPEIAPELSAVYAAYLALPPHRRPVAVPWDLDNDRSADPVHTGPYTNPDQLRRLEQLQAHPGLTGHQR